VHYLKQCIPRIVSGLGVTLVLLIVEERHEQEVQGEVALIPNSGHIHVVGVPKFKNAGQYRLLRLQLFPLAAYIAHLTQLR
jgi:hypothetical protein